MTSNRTKQRLEAVSFEDAAVFAEEVNTTVGERSIRHQITAILDKIAETFDVDGSEVVGEQTLNRIKDFITKELDATSLSDRYKAQLVTHIKGIDNLHRLLVWLQSLEATS